MILGSLINHYILYPSYVPYKAVSKLPKQYSQVPMLGWILTSFENTIKDFLFTLICCRIDEEEKTAVEEK